MVALYVGMICRDDMQGRSKRILGGRAHSIFIPTLQCNVQYLNLLSITRAYYNSYRANYIVIITRAFYFHTVEIKCSCNIHTVYCNLQLLIEGLLHYYFDCLLIPLISTLFLPLVCLLSLHTLSFSKVFITHNMC